MNYESKAWAEAKGACLRNFNEQGDIDSVNGALALRPQIEKIVDQIWEEGFDNIYFIASAAPTLPRCRLRSICGVSLLCRSMWKMPRNT